MVLRPGAAPPQRARVPAYTFLRPVTCVSHTGSRPISIVWRLRHPIPARLLPPALCMAAA